MSQIAIADLEKESRNSYPRFRERSEKDHSVKNEPKVNWSGIYFDNNTMISSTLIPTTFTLEIISDESAQPGTLNLPSDPPPAQLIGMEGAGDDWRQIHADTVAVAVRTHKREQNIDTLKNKESNKRQEKSWDLFGGSSKKKKDKTKKGGDQLQNIEDQIKEERNAITKDWESLAQQVTYIGQSMTCM